MEFNRIEAVAVLTLTILKQGALLASSRKKDAPEAESSSRGRMATRNEL